MGTSYSQEEYDQFHIHDTFVHHAKWSQAVKSFNKVNCESLLTEIVNTHHQFGSQPYIVYAIHDTARKKRIYHAAQNMPQLMICNTIFVFCARSDIVLSNAIAVEPGIIRNVLNTVWGAPRPDHLRWSTRQTHLSIGFAMAACHDQGIDSHSIEDFDTSYVHSLLDLPECIHPIALLAIGSPD